MSASEGSKDISIAVQAAVGGGAGEQQQLLPGLGFRRSSRQVVGERLAAL